MNMKSWLHSFNIYLLAAGVVLGSGCASRSLSANKDYATLSVYLEGLAGNGSLVQVGRAKIPVLVQGEALLTEEDLARAKLVDNPDGTCAIQVTFNDHGAVVLDMNTTANRGRHLVLYCQLRPRRGSQGPADGAATSPDKTAPGQRGFFPWLSMMLIRTAVTGGSLQFTVDVSRAEAEQIVLGLNNLVTELNK
jgi:hypothetical protein